MSFENWDKFLVDTLRQIQERKEAQKQGGRAAGSEATGGAGDDRKSKRSAQTIQAGVEP